MDNAAMNMGVHISEPLLLLLLGKYPEVKLLDRMLPLCLIFSGTTIMLQTHVHKQMGHHLICRLPVS